MERYSSYKDSGVQWIGEIPSHWRIPSVGKLFEIKAGGDAKPQYYSYDKDEKHPYPVYTNTKDPNSVYAYTSKPLYDARTITVTGRGEIGRAIFRPVAYDAIIRLLSLRPKVKLVPQFYAFFIDTVIPFTSDSAAIGQLSAVQLKPKYVTLPPLIEQEKIVDYLEGKTSKIDAYVAEKEKEIQLLQELKQKTIADAITKGLNPDVKMKESRTIFFGQIPEHWEERKMKYCFIERSEKNHPEEPVLCATQSQGVIPQSLYQNRVVVVNKGFEGLKFVKVGDFVISLRSFEGGIEYAYYQGIISAAYTILTPIENEYAGYFKLLFKCHPFIQVLQTCVTGIREGQNINYQMFGRKHIPLPPLDEQRAIVAYIDEKCKKIDTLVSELQAEIDNMKEYKQRLVADCVTGQVNVQDKI